MRTVSKKLLSIMLAALLLVSAVPFQSLAEGDTTATEASVETTVPETTVPETTTAVENGTVVAGDSGSAAKDITLTHDPSIHTNYVWGSDASSHWQICYFSNADGKCEFYGAEVTGTKTAHYYDDDGVCKVCGYECTHSGGTIKKGGVAATCITAGKEDDVYCATCGMLLSTGKVIPATGSHTYDPTTGICTTEGCGAKDPSTESDLVLDANGGTVSGYTSITLTVKKYYPVSLPDAVREGYTFIGWFTAKEGGTQVYSGATYDASYTTLYAHWTEKTFNLKVRYVLNGVLSTATTILDVNVPADAYLWQYLYSNVSSTVTTELTKHPGYTWASNYWYDAAGTIPLVDQTYKMDKAQVVYVNFVCSQYTLYFNANGGTVTPTSKTVSYGQPVGTLPTPVKSGSVFQGWKASDGTIYTADTKYMVAGNTSLEAVWSDEALVLLRIYINGNTATCDRIVSLDGYVVNNNVTRSAVTSIVCAHYAPYSGTSLSVAGLYDDDTWGNYASGGAGVDNIAVSSDHVTNIYVMVKNANSINSTGYTSSGSTFYSNNGIATIGNGTYTYTYNYANGTYTINGITYYGTNPKTGDSSMIEVAAAVMGLAAASMAVVLFLHFRRKRIA